MRVLLVEDDEAIGDGVADGLRREGYEVDWVTTGAAALEATGYDFVLLDLGLPDLDGSVVCRSIREHSAVPLIVVTARSDEIDRVGLLDLGADDYLVKPFGLRELGARIRAVLRRTGAEPEGSSASARLIVDRRTRNVTWDGDAVALTPKEFDLLAALADDPGAVLGREELMSRVWDENWWGSTRTLDVHVAALRRKLDPEAIETVRGVGFRLADGVA